MSKLMPFDVVGVILEGGQVLCSECGDTEHESPIFRDTEGSQLYCEKCGDAIAHRTLIEE